MTKIASACVVSAPPRLRVKRSPPRRKDSGYALLLVLLMGAVIAITLYMEIPRIAFDSQRQKEQLLIERGEQYKRAIQLFVKANNRWPGRIEDLEGVAHDLVHSRVPGDARHSQQVECRRPRGQEQRQGIVDAGVDVEDHRDRVRHDAVRAHRSTTTAYAA